MRLDEFLNQQKVSFERLHHRPAYTANRIAQTLHVKGKEMAKTVLLRSSPGYVLAVLPASHRVDLERVREDLGDHQQVALAAEEEIDQIFPDCERGAMPPFGSLYDLTTLVDDSLAEDDDIVFEGQDHEEAIRMRCHDYLAVEHPRIGHFAAQL
jgi:Ala-tRNA(Pro) deacylase